MIMSKDWWNHCPRILNPADMPSRGLVAYKLVSSKIWWEGPPFLKMSEQHWPKQEEIRSTNLALTELTKTPHQETHVLSVISEHTHDKPNESH